MESRTRELILQQIARNGRIGTAEISRALDLTQAGVRHHLTALLKSGHIEVVDERKPADRPGHPARTFRLSASNRPNNLITLVKALLELFPTALSSTDSIRLLAKKLVDPLPPATPPARRIKQTLQYLEGHHYQPAWEARSLGPRIRFNNCPYASILKSYPKLCLMDTCLLEHLSGGDVLLLTHIDPDWPESSFCLFDIIVR